MASVNLLDFAPAGDGTTPDTGAIQQAIDACGAAGGGTVLLPAGRRFLAGSIELRSNVELHVERGAVLLGSSRSEDHTAAAFPSRPDSSPAFIVADGAENIAVTGSGVIDGQGRAFFSEDRRYIYAGGRRRPMMFRFSNCRNVTFRDVTIRDSANWALNLSCCEDVVIHAVRILNDLKLPNCDRISDCLIQAGDDCIVIKNRAEHPDGGPSENITVTNCVLTSTSSAVKIGTESIDDFRNIVVTHCVVRSSNRGLSIQLRDGGTVENVLFADCIVETRYFHPGWWGRAEPIYVTAIHRAPGTPLGKVRNVRFSNILCRGENGVFIAGSPDSPIEGLVLDNVRVEIDKWSKWPGGQHDRRPCMSPDTGFGIAPEKDLGLTQHPTPGIFAEHTRDLLLRNVQVAWGANRQPYWSHALEASHSPHLKLDNFEGPAGNEHLPAHKID